MIGGGPLPPCTHSGWYLKCILFVASAVQTAPLSNHFFPFAPASLLALDFQTRAVASRRRLCHDPPAPPALLACLLARPTAPSTLARRSPCGRRPGIAPPLPSVASSPRHLVTSSPCRCRSRPTVDVDTLSPSLRACNSPASIGLLSSTAFSRQDAQYALHLGRCVLLEPVQLARS